MKAIFVMGVLAILLLATAALGSGIPDLALSTATAAHGDADVAVVYVVPDGSGEPFNAAVLAATGAPADATITVQLLDGSSVPIADYPLEDLWLSNVGEGSFTPCSGGTICDSNTDATGCASWCAPLQAGGWSQGPTRVIVSGDGLTSGDVLVGFVSPDITGDGQTNLKDIQKFAYDYYFDRDAFRSDFEHDGVINLSDVAKLAKGYGDACP